VTERLINGRQAKKPFHISIYRIKSPATSIISEEVLINLAASSRSINWELSITNIQIMEFWIMKILLSKSWTSISVDWVINKTCSRLRWVQIISQWSIDLFKIIIKIMKKYCLYYIYHFFLVSFKVSKEISSQICLYFLHTVFLPLL